MLAYSEYNYYICGIRTKNVRLVKSEARILAAQKEADFLAKVDELQRMAIAHDLVYKTTDICKMAAREPAKRFYIDAKTALEQYCKYRKGESMIQKNECRKMYAEIFSRFERIMTIKRVSGQKIVMHELMEEVLESEAPCFYYEEGSAVKMYYRFMSRKRERDRKRQIKK